MPEPEKVQYIAKVSIAPGPFSALAIFIPQLFSGLSCSPSPTMRR
jgi:hypothetical protein